MAISSGGSAVTVDPIVWLNGESVPMSEARVPVLDRGFIFGDGVYEVVPVYAAAAIVGAPAGARGRVPFRIAQHLARLDRSLSKIGIDNPYDAAGWRRLVADVVSANEQAGAISADEHVLVYLQVTRGVAKRMHEFPVGIRPTVFAMTNAMKLPGESKLTNGVCCVTAEDRRWLHCDIKSVSLLGNVLMAQYAAEHGALETIQLRDGFVTEGSSSNVWVAKDGVLSAPPRSNRILEGIRYGLIEELAQASGVRFESREIARDALFAADEVMISSATKELLPVTGLDGHAVGSGAPGPVFRALYAAYQRAKARDAAEEQTA